MTLTKYAILILSSQINMDAGLLSWVMLCLSNLLNIETNCVKLDNEVIDFFYSKLFVYAVVGNGFDFCESITKGSFLLDRIDNQWNILLEIKFVFCWTKVTRSSSSNHRNQTPMFEWFVISIGTKNGNQQNMYLKKLDNMFNCFNIS